MTTLVALTAVILAAFWLRAGAYRRKFKRALRVMDRGGKAQRATRLFWMLVVLAVVVAVLRMYVEAHVR
jgi:membrane-associated phospholipid phosphatase